MAYEPTTEDLSYLESILNPEYVDEVRAEAEESLPSVKESLKDPVYIKNFKGILAKFLLRDSNLPFTVITANNEANFVVECIGLEALYEGSFGVSNYFNKTYVYAGRLIWKSYNLAKLTRAEKVSVAGTINNVFEHAYFNTYYGES